LRHLNAEKPLAANFSEGLAGKTSLGVDRRGIRFRNFGGGTGAGRKIVLANIDNPGSARNSLSFHSKSPQLPFGLQQSERHYPESPRTGQPLTGRQIVT
jgi:hypothetical protein